MGNQVFKLLLALIVVCFTVGGVVAREIDCVDATESVKHMHREVIRLLTDDGELLEIQALIADEGFERASGYQFICPTVIDQSFILFRYPAETMGRFHMENVPAPLDIAFFDSAGKTVAVFLMETYSENSRPLYGPDQPFQFALEARAGFFASHGFSAGKGRLMLTSD